MKYLEYALGVWNRAGRLQVDVYHANDANTLPAAWLAARRNTARLVYDAHELETGRNWAASRVAGIYRRLTVLPERVFIRQADAVITVNQSIARRLAALYKIPTPTVVMNCPETLRETTQRSERLRTELNIPDELKIALYQGGVERGRGIESFLLAVQSTPGVAAVLLGDGTLLETLRQRLQNSEYQRVYLPGKVDPTALPAYTSSADIGIVLIEPSCESYRLSLPNKIFEYMHAGLPVLGSDLPEIKHIINEEKIGLIVNPQNPDEIASTLRQLLANPQAFAEYQSRAQAASQKYTWEIERVKLLELYANFTIPEGVQG